VKKKKVEMEGASVPARNEVQHLLRDDITAPDKSKDRS